MHIQQRQNGIFVCQCVYTEKVLERIKMHEANPIATPYDRNSGGTEDSVGCHVPYREAVGCLMFLMTGTCPDIALDVSRAVWTMDRPTLADWIDRKRILRYLRVKSNYGLLYGACNSKEVLRYAYSAGRFSFRPRFRESAPISPPLAGSLGS